MREIAAFRANLNDLPMNLVIGEIEQLTAHLQTIDSLRLAKLAYKSAARGRR